MEENVEMFDPFEHLVICDDEIVNQFKDLIIYDNDNNYKLEYNNSISMKEYKCNSASKCKGFTKLIICVLLVKFYPLLMDELIKNLHLINIPNCLGITPLMFVCYYVGHICDIELFDLLINNGANVNSISTNKRNCLNSAIYNKSIYSEYMINKLLQHGINIDLQDIPDKTYLMYCVINNYTNKVKLLIDTKANLDLQCAKEYNLTALHYAIGKNYNIFDLLIKSNANLNVQSVSGDTPLILCCYFNKIDCTKHIKLLINSGANLNIQNIYGCTALINASYNGCINRMKVIKQLLKKKANVNLHKKNGETALILACLHSKLQDSIEVIKLLIKNKANVNAVENHGVSALHAAAHTSKSDTKNVINILRK